LRPVDTPERTVFQVYFFFQAEDGIRDSSVTGVQTCALPIFDIKLSYGKEWRPENFTKQTYGPVTVVRALAESLNLATVGVGMDEIGRASCRERGERWGGGGAER